MTILRAEKRRLAVAPIAALILLVFARPGPGGEAEARAERYDGMVEALNVASERRTSSLEAIYSELRGPYGQEMQEFLRGALFRPNSLIVQGAVEALAMLGDAGDLPNVEALLATADKPEVKVLAIRLLPAFCLRSERARFRYIAYAAGYERLARTGTLEPLRRPPLTRRGRLDPELERLRGRVTRILAGQFDPVAAALAYLDDLLYGQAARRAVRYLAGDALGKDPGMWSRIWAAQGEEMEIRSADDVEEIRLAALSSLADMGAEGMPEVVEAFRFLFLSGGDVLRQAAFEAMGAMCRAAFGDFIALSSLRSDAEAETKNWVRRRDASAVVLSVFAVGSAGAELRRNGGAGVFAAAAGCLGAALSYPDAYPDPDGSLAANRANGLELLRRMLLMPDMTPQKRIRLVSALGDIGAERAVDVLIGLVNSPYCSPEAGLDGAAMADAAVTALRVAATGEHAGRAAAREALLEFLGDDRMFPPLRPGTPPVGIAHMVLWQLQRLARSNDGALEAALWRARLGW